MKNITFAFLLAMVFVGCSKSSGGGTTPTPPTTAEENIVFTLDPDPGVTVAAAQSATYTFKVNVTSKLTSSGVKVDVTTKKDADNTVVESKQVTSTTAGIDLSVSSLSAGVLYNVTVVVTSAKTATNTATKTFKVARK